MHHFANTQQCRNNFPCRHMRSVIPCQQKRTFWDNHFSSPSTPGAEGKAPPRNRVWNQIDERIGNTTFTFSKIVFLHNMTGLHGNCWNYVPESYTYSKPLQYVQLFGQFMICDRLAPGNLEIINYWIWMKRAQPITLGGSNSKAKNWELSCVQLAPTDLWLFSTYSAQTLPQPTCLGYTDDATLLNLDQSVHMSNSDARAASTQKSSLG